MSAEPAPLPSIYGPMPDVGTMKICDFCHFVVTLKQAPSGWHYWCAETDPVDGQRHCDGGQPPANAADTAVWTLHIPAPLYDKLGDRVLQRWYWRYTPEGEGRFA